MFLITKVYPRSALDTIDAVFKENRLGMGLSHMRLPIDQVLVTGASKRGWTTWTLASVDKRYYSYTVWYESYGIIIP